MFEDVDMRNELVDKLVERVKQDYEKERDFFIQLLYNTNKETEPQENWDNGTLDDVATRSVILSWIKHKIINSNGAMFREERESRLQDNTSQYYISRDIVELLTYGKRTLYQFLEFYVTKNNIPVIRFLDLGNIFNLYASNFSFIIPDVNITKWFQSEERKALYENPKEWEEI